MHVIDPEETLLNRSGRGCNIRSEGLGTIARRMIATPRQRCDEYPHIDGEVLVADLEGVGSGDESQLRRQIGSPRHGCAVDEDGKHRFSADTGLAELGPYEIRGIVQPRVAVGIKRRQPGITDEGDDCITIAEALENALREDIAGRQRVDIAEHTSGTELLD